MLGMSMRRRVIGVCRGLPRMIELSPTGAYLRCCYSMHAEVDKKSPGKVRPYTGPL